MICVQDINNHSAELIISCGVNIIHGQLWDWNSICTCSVIGFIFKMCFKLCLAGFSVCYMKKRMILIDLDVLSRPRVLFSCFLPAWQIECWLGSFPDKLQTGWVGISFSLLIYKCESGLKCYCEICMNSWISQKSKAFVFVRGQWM